MAVATPLVFALFGRALGLREERLTRAQNEVQRLREEFVAVVAHDLRNPINAIGLQVDQLLRRGGQREIHVDREALLRVRHSAARLAEMVTDLLDAACIDASRVSLQREPIDSLRAVRTLVERIRPTLGDHPIDLYGDEAPLVVLADPVRLDQIVTNLLDNAAKYSPPCAPISVAVERADGGVSITVTDRGAGIAVEDQARLFDRFYQTKRARALRSGLGLGLFITRGLVEAQGGRITVESVLESGSTFRVWFPRVASENVACFGSDRPKP